MSLPRRTTALFAATVLAATLSACSGDDEKASDKPTSRESATTAANECAQTTLDRMDRPQRVGQLLMVGVEADNPQRATGWVGTYHLGGIVLTGSANRSTADVKKDVEALTDAAGEGPSPFVATTQRGGDAQTLTGDGFKAAPDAATLGASEPQEVVDQLAGIASSLRAAGITMNLSPVADPVLTDGADDNPVVGSNAASFGSDPNEVATNVHLAVQAMVSQDVVPVLSSFPGQGRLQADPADGAATDETTSSDDQQLVPFRTGIAAGAEVVMVSGATYAKLDAERPAVVSAKVIDELLRDQMEFDGVVISSDLSQAGALDDIPLDQRGVQFIEAGGDLVMSAGSSESRPLLNGMLAADQASPEFAKRVDAAASRVLTLKAQRGLISCDY